MTTAKPVRHHGLVAFQRHMGSEDGGWRLWRARGKTFLVEWREYIAEKAPCNVDIERETFVLFPFRSGSVTHNGATRHVAARSVCIVPPGKLSASTDARQPLIFLSPIPDERTAPSTLNDADYTDGNDGIRPVGTPYAYADRAEVQVVAIDEIVPPPDKPRLKIIQSNSLSINWIEYDGPRDRTKLSPHSHDDFEQGSLAIEGNFIHHLRIPWGPDADLWRDDVHLDAPPKSLCIIPPRMIHTTEGIGLGKHILIDVFSPPREDFIVKGWIFNSGKYRKA